MKVFSTKIALTMMFLFFLLLMTACANASGQTEATATAVAPAAPEDTSADVIRVGILSKRSAMVVNEKWGELMRYLNETTGASFTIVSLTNQEIVDRTATGEIDFVFANPLVSVQLQRLYNTDFLATLSYPDTGTEFGGLIIVDNDSDIETLADLRGKDVACVAFQTAAGGCAFQIFHLLQADIDPFTDFNNFSEINSQDNIVFAVLNGTMDAGFIRTGQLEAMVDEGKILDMNEIRILDLAEDDYIYPHTTRLYPEWPFAATINADPELAEKVQTALLALPADHPAAQAAKIGGFVPITDYTAMNELIETLKLPTWDSDS